ncbi:hypothetical protein P7C71_g5604, partial [Lecanoromycetidae sp. Uapishka_2]
MSPRTMLITGSNRGIGFSILQALATHSPGDHYLLAARNPKSGTAAIKELRKLGLQAEIDLVQLDVSSEPSIKAAEEEVRKKYGRLDILINNAGIGVFEKPDHSNLQESYAETFNTNIIGVALMMTTFLPLMKETSGDPRVINISSARASLHLSSTGNLPPSRVISYSVSKTALNALTIEYAKAEPDVRFYAASPGHCKTAFNGFRGSKDPLDGAKVVVELALADEKYANGFWQLEGDEEKASPVPW